MLSLYRGAERVGEAVDLLARAPLGDRDKQAVLVLGILAAERVAGSDAALGAALQHPVDRCVEAKRELARDRRLVEQLHPRHRHQPLACVRGAPDQQLAQLAEALATEPGEVDRGGQGVERLRGADVVSGLLATDVLLASLQGEDEAATTVDVVGFAGNPARHAPNQLLAAAEEAE